MSKPGLHQMRAKLTLPLNAIEVEPVRLPPNTDMVVCSYQTLRLRGGIVSTKDNGIIAKCLGISCDGITRQQNLSLLHSDLKADLNTKITS